MTSGSDHYWNIAWRLRQDVSQRVVLYGEVVKLRQAVALGEQRLLFERRQLDERGGANSTVAVGALVATAVHADATRAPATEEDEVASAKLVL